MNLRTAPYLEQNERWPSSGRPILAQYTDDYIVVYQAYKHSTGRFAAEHQYFGGDSFSYRRMSWIKPNFLWMMYRSGWGQKPGQRSVVAIKLKRAYFESILEHAVESSFNPDAYDSREQWEAAMQASNVRLQWDPDHDPHGAKQTRKAIQLGLRGDFLAPFKGDGIVEVEDISDFVAEGWEHVAAGRLDQLVTPLERPYIPNTPGAAGCDQ